MKKIVLFLLLVVPVLAQFDWAVTDMRCGDGRLDKFELCEKGVDDNFCDELGELLKIDTNCDTQHCTCLPRINMAFCGNGNREGVELCDGEDFCPEFANITGVELKCNPTTCGCDIVETIPKDYNPVVVEDLENLSETPSVCGNKKVERDEECDPPNTLCTAISNDAGICTDKCRCVLPDDLDKPEIDVSESSEVEVNETAMNESGAEVNESEIKLNESEEALNESETMINDAESAVNETINIEESVEDTESPGFFSRIWNWFMGLFR